MKELVIKIKWENEVEFCFQAKEEGGDWTTVVAAEENGHISELWQPIQQVCERYIRSKLSEIGQEMRS